MTIAGLCNSKRMLELAAGQCSLMIDAGPECELLIPNRDWIMPLLVEFVLASIVNFSADASG